MINSPSYEHITFDDGLPIKVKVRRLNMLRLRWHSHPELLFVVKGSIGVYINQESCVLQTGQMMFIGSGELHTIEPAEEDNLLVEIQMDGAALTPGKNAPAYNFFRGRFLAEMQNGALDLTEMNRLMALIVYEYDKRPKGYAQQIIGYANMMIAWLIRYDYLTESTEGTDPSNQLYSRMNDILRYMYEHYDERLTLQDVAEHEHLSYYYLSSSFSKITGMTFREHLTQIRLQKSIGELCGTRNSIEMIAAAYGFNSARSYSTLFARQYGCSPAAYRESYLKKILQPDSLDNDSADYEVIYALMNNSVQIAAPRPLWQEERELRVDVSNSAGSLNHIWSVTATCGRAADLLQKDIQEIVRRARKDIGFTYLRFHGLFSDEMMICNRDDEGRIRYNWIYVNQIFDFLLSIGMRPFLELSFMPSELASGSETVFWYRANITPPRDMAEWESLIYHLIRHCVERYGYQEVSQWKVEVWSQPDYKGYFWTGDMEDYFKLYRASALAVKRACSDLQIGGPGITSIEFEKSEWIRRFTVFCKEQQVPLDFITFHLYADRHVYSARGSEMVPRWVPNSQIPRGIERELAENHISAADGLVRQFHITEWNLSARYLFCVRDTVFMAPYVIHTLLSCAPMVDSMAFWTLSDLLNEIKMPVTAFHGGMGLFHAPGIPKPAYLALRLMHQLGNQVIAQGDGWIVTRRGELIQILMYHLVYLDQLAQQVTDFTSEFTGNVYALFEEKPMIRYEITLENMGEKYHLTRYEINRRYGSAYDVWSAMGAMSDMRREEIDYLRTASVPKLSSADIAAEDGRLCLEALLPPHGCQLIILEPM
ncbi:MAG: AraC family transcriptional regulator [Clostridia bacterium]|nr:AraC family transcriptional regulator [Clostridia bacterium]